MTDLKGLDVIIIGGSYAGLSAGLSLGRALRSVLIIDGGTSCNQQTPHSYNFLTQDGECPENIREKAKKEVLKYNTVQFLTDLVVSAEKSKEGFTIVTRTGKEFTAKNLIFATGVKDIMPEIEGFAECWGISVLHCPYCHGYEIKNEKTGILANGDAAFHYAQLISNWTKDLTIFTNGKSSLEPEHVSKINNHKITIVEKEIACLKHEKGQISQIVFKDDSTFDLKAIYASTEFEQQCKIPEQLGCKFTEQGLIEIDSCQDTIIPNVYACGDSTSAMRSVANAVESGNLVGGVINHAMTEEEF